jgi:YbgC/YbaW family acyl-CoA thioester hydrolase
MQMLPGNIADLSRSTRCPPLPHIPAMSASHTPMIQTEVQVMFFDTDCAGVVHNIAYLRFIEICRTLLAEQLGMGLSEMAGTGVFPVVLRIEIDYKKPARLGDKLLISGRLENFGRTRFCCVFDIRRLADGALIAESRQTLAVVQMPQGRPIRLPGDWVTRFPDLRVGGQSAEG